LSSARDRSVASGREKSFDLGHGAANFYRIDEAGGPRKSNREENRNDGERNRQLDDIESAAGHTYI
jgi:hypothetical protein